MNNRMEDIQKQILMNDNSQLRDALMDYFLSLDNYDTVKIPEKIGNTLIDSLPRDIFNDNIKKLIIPGTVKSINRNAFADMVTLEEVILEEGVESIDAWAFACCPSLRRVYLPDSIKEIESYCFTECHSLEEIRLPSYIDYIGAYALSETNLERVKLPDGIKKLSTSLFYKCLKLHDVIFGKGLKVIGDAAFQECIALKKIVIPDGVEVIRRNAFSYCTNLEEVVLPSSIKKLAYGNVHAFNGCSRLRNIVADDLDKKIIVATGEDFSYEDLQAFTNNELKNIDAPKRKYKSLREYFHLKSLKHNSPFDDIFDRHERSDTNKKESLEFLAFDQNVIQRAGNYFYDDFDFSPTIKIKYEKDNKLKQDKENIELNNLMKNPMNIKDIVSLLGIRVYSKQNIDDNYLKGLEKIKNGGNPIKVLKEIVLMYVHDCELNSAIEVSKELVELRNNSQTNYILSVMHYLNDDFDLAVKNFTEGVNIGNFSKKQYYFLLGHFILDGKKESIENFMFDINVFKKGLVVDLKFNDSMRDSSEYSKKCIECGMSFCENDL